MGEAYWLGGGSAPIHTLTESLRQVRLNPDWIEETHILNGSSEASWPGVVFSFPLPSRAAPALRGLQGLVAALRHGEREWLLFGNQQEQRVDWCVLASAAGVGRFNILPRIRLWDLPPLKNSSGALTSKPLLAWLETNEVTSRAMEAVFWLDDGMSIPEIAQGRRFAWPEVGLPALLNTWAAQAVDAAQMQAILLLATTAGGWVGLVAEVI